MRHFSKASRFKLMEATSVVDPGPPEGVPLELWARRLDAARQQMQSFVAEGVESAERGDFVEGSEARTRLREKQQARRARKTE